MNKWETLKNLIDAELSWPVHYSCERPVERDKLYRVKTWMNDLEKQEAEENERQSGGDEGSSEEV